MRNKKGQDKYQKTRKGLVSVLYGNMRASARKRGMDLPDFSKAEFVEWMNNQTHFETLFTRWVESGHDKSKRPSPDRLDDSISYTFDNLQLLTWQENYNKGVRKKSIIQLTLDGKFIKEWPSSSEAARELKLKTNTSISAVARGEQKTAYGFKWKFE
tara:strand:- start:46 stop:516 length:471 start_codon:yes stop_codon:yes gene_type:complete